jgi:hypothetical protein
MTMFKNYTGEVQTSHRGRAISKETHEIRAALLDSVTSGFKSIPGTTDADKKVWRARLSNQASILDLKVQIRSTTTGEIAFKARRNNPVIELPPVPVTTRKAATPKKPSARKSTVAKG